MSGLLDEVRMVIEFAESYKGPGWWVSSGGVECFRYKDTGEMLWTALLFNRSGVGEKEDRLLIYRENGIFQARSVDMTRWRPASHYRKKVKSLEDHLRP